MRDILRSSSVCHSIRAQPDPAKGDPSKRDLSKSDFFKHVFFKSDPSKSDLSKSDPSKSNLSKSDLSKSDQSNSYPYNSDPYKSDPFKSDLFKSDPYKSDPSKFNPFKSDPSKSEISKSNMSKSDTFKNTFKNRTQLSNHIEQQLQWGAAGSWHWNGSVPGMGWEEPVPLLAILNTAVQSIDLQGNRSGTGSWHQKGQPFCPFWRHGAGAAPPVTELPCIR